jgi:hypothetical protein
MGNPETNSLPECQIKRVANLVSLLQDSVESTGGVLGEKIPYRFWIDTLCCPVEKSSNKIALKRITDVYTNAAHVLVLDASLTHCISVNIDPAELMLRALGASAWMRRLWTFQGSDTV